MIIKLEKYISVYLFDFTDQHNGKHNQVFAKNTTMIPQVGIFGKKHWTKDKL